jgi:hypothetical protein
MSNRQSPTTFIGQLDFSGTTHAGVKTNSLTTAQRDALTPASGMLIYNTSNTRFEKYENGSWQTTNTGAASKTFVTVGGSTADYVTDGTADNVEIQAALDSLGTTGGTVYIQPGTYSISTTINLPKNCKLMGSGYATTLNLASAGTIITMPSGTSLVPLIIYCQVDSIRFRGNFANSIAIDCGQYSQEFSIKNCWFHTWATGSSCVYANGTNKKFQIIGNFFGGTSTGVYYCIRLSATGDVQIVGNNFHQYYIAVYGDTEKTNISGNDFYSSDVTYSPNTACISVGISTGGLQQINVSANTFSDTDYGIRLGQSNQRGAAISSNFFRNIESNAIYVRGSDHAITGNYFQDIARSGTGNNSHGILLADGAVRVKITANNVYNSHTNMGYAIAILDVATGAIAVIGNSQVGAQTAFLRKGSFTDLEIGFNST